MNDRIAKLELHRFRGATQPVSIPFESDHSMVMIFGENGSGKSTLVDAIDFVLDLAKKYIPSSHAGILFTKETGDALYFAAARGKGSKKMLETDIPMDNGIISRSLRNGSAFSVADPVSDARYDPTFTKVTGIKVDSLLCAPIQKGPRVFGVLTMMNRDGRDDFHQYDVNVASYLGNQLGEYIQRQFDQQPLN